MISKPGANHECPQQQSHPSCSFLTLNSRWDAEKKMVSNCLDLLVFTAWFSKQLHNPCASTGGVVGWWHHGWDKGQEKGRTTSFSSSVGASCLQLTCVTPASLYSLKKAGLPRLCLACKAVPYLLARYKMPTANTVILAWRCYIFTQEEG